MKHKNESQRRSRCILSVCTKEHMCMSVMRVQNKLWKKNGIIFIFTSTIWIFGPFFSIVLFIRSSFVMISVIHSHRHTGIQRNIMIKKRKMLRQVVFFHKEFSQPWKNKHSCINTCYKARIEAVIPDWNEIYIELFFCILIKHVCFFEISIFCIMCGLLWFCSVRRYLTVEADRFDIKAFQVCFACTFSNY